MVEQHSTYVTSDSEIFTDERDAEEHEARIWLEAWFVGAHLMSKDEAWFMADILATNADSIVYRLRRLTKDYTVNRRDKYR